MQAILILVLVIAALIVVVIYGSRFLMRKAIRDVVSIFRRYGATSPGSAKTAQELGLVRANPLERMFRMRDYKPQALTVLGQADIVQMTEEGRLYLSESALANSPLKNFARIS